VAEIPSEGWIGRSKYCNESDDPSKQCDMLDDPDNILWYRIDERPDGRLTKLRCDPWGNKLPKAKQFSPHEVYKVDKKGRRVKDANGNYEKETVVWAEVYRGDPDRKVTRTEGEGYNRREVYDHTEYAERILIATPDIDWDKKNKWDNGYHRNRDKHFPAAWAYSPWDGQFTSKKRILDRYLKEQRARFSKAVDDAWKKRGDMYSCWGSGEYSYPIYRLVGETKENKVLVLSALYHTYPYKFDELKAKMPEAIENVRDIKARANKLWADKGGAGLIRQFMHEASSAFSEAYSNSCYYNN
jgi:hypothetical protein